MTTRDSIGTPGARTRASFLVATLLVLIAAAAGCAPGTGEAGVDEESGLTDEEIAARRPPMRARYALSAQYPEGGTFDRAANAFYVGSLGDGSVRRVDAVTGAERVLFRETAPGRWWTLGMTVDAPRRRLWVCAMDDREPARAGYVWIFDLTTGRRVANHDLSRAAPGATCTDVAVTRDGRGYVTDRELPNVYRVDATNGATLFASGGELGGTIIGQNAIVVLPDESALMTVTYLPPRVVRVGLADRSIRRVALDGSFFDHSPLAGADGMVYYQGSLYVAFTSEIHRVTPTDAGWTRARVTSVDVPHGHTDLVATPSGLYLLNGQAIRFAVGTPTDPFALTRFTAL